MSEGNKMRLDLAQNIGNRFMKHLEPFVERMSIAGSVRREVDYVHDIEVCCVPKDAFSMGLCFPEGFYGMTTNGTRLKKFKYGQDGLIPINIELYITTESDWGRMLAIRTGSSVYSRHLAVQWNRRGYCGTADGLRAKIECDHKGNVWRIKPGYKNCPTLPPPFHSEEDFFAFIGEKWIEPKQRSWVSNKPEYNYNV